MCVYIYIYLYLYIYLYICIYIHNDVYLVVSSPLPSDSGAVMGQIGSFSTFPDLENPRAHEDLTNEKTMVSGVIAINTGPLTEWCVSFVPYGPWSFRNLDAVVFLGPCGRCGWELIWPNDE